METTDWDSYGTGNYEKCADCMVHCGYEPTAADGDAGASAAGHSRSACAARAPRAHWRRKSRSTSQRPAQYVFSEQVQQKLSEIRTAEAEPNGENTASAA